MKKFVWLTCWLVVCCCSCRSRMVVNESREYARDSLSYQRDDTLSLRITSLLQSTSGIEMEQITFSPPDSLQRQHIQSIIRVRKTDTVQQKHHTEANQTRKEKYEQITEQTSETSTQQTKQKSLPWKLLTIIIVLTIPLAVNLIRRI